MHFPVFPLVLSTACRFCSLERVLVDRLEGKVPCDKFDLPSSYVIFFDLWPRLTDVSAAERSLIVGKLDQRELSAFLSFHRCSVALQDHVLRHGGRYKSPCQRSRTSLQHSHTILAVLLS